MLEPVVATLMTQSPVTVTADLPFKQVVCALLASDSPAVPVVTADHRPIGLITECDLFANLEFLGGTTPAPVLGGSAARRRRRKATAATARDLMTSPVATIKATTPISKAACRLGGPVTPPLCVVDDDQRLVGLLTRRDLLAVYRRSDVDIAGDIHAAVATDRTRPTRQPAELTVEVHDGVVTLTGALTYRSQVDHAFRATCHVPGVTAVHNNLTYEIDDMLVTGF